MPVHNYREELKYAINSNSSPLSPMQLYAKSCFSRKSRQGIQRTITVDRFPVNMYVVWIQDLVLRVFDGWD